VAPTLTRVRERIETDLSDTEVQNLIDEATSAIVLKAGPDPDPENPVTVTLRGLRKLVTVGRRIDETQDVIVVERTYVGPDGSEWWPGPWWLGWDTWDTWDGWDGWDPYSGYFNPLWPVGVTEKATTLDDTDYRVWNAGRGLQRLPTGPNNRLYWGPMIEVTFVPVNDQAQRDEVAIKLVILAVQYQGVIEQRVGDVQTVHGIRSTGSGGAGPLVYSDERDRLIGTLMPRAGLMLR
jgi:hypothetical protein